MRTDSATTRPITCRLVKPRVLRTAISFLPLAHGDAHGVGDHEEDGEGHREADAVEEEGEVPGHGHEARREGLLGLGAGLGVGVLEERVDRRAHLARLLRVGDLRRSSVPAWSVRPVAS